MVVVLFIFSTHYFKDKLTILADILCISLTERLDNLQKIKLMRPVKAFQISEHKDFYSYDHLNPR